MRQLERKGTIKLRLRRRRLRTAKELVPIARVLLRAFELFGSRRVGEEKVVVAPVGGQMDDCLGVLGSLTLGHLTKKSRRQGQHGEKGEAQPQWASAAENDWLRKAEDTGHKITP